MSSRENSRKRLARALYALLAGLSLTCGAFAGEDTNTVGSDLPDMGSPENAVLSKQDEFQVGLMAMHQLRSQGVVMEDPELSDYIQNLGSRLAAQARDDNQNFTYSILRSNEINAFATFGGFVFINSALILMTQNESQLAGVMAHETAHVRQRHIARGILQQSHASLATTAAMLAAVLIGALAGGGGPAMEGAIAMGQGVALQQAMNFSRAEEAEADRVGIGIMAGAGYDATAMATVFELMQRQIGDSETPGPFDMLRNHPVTRDRTAEARARATQYAHNPVSESILYPWMHERLRVLVAPTDKDMVVYYEQLRERRPLSDPERYGEALAQTAGGQPGAAAVTLRELLDKYPQITALYTALGQALQADHQSAAALKNFEHAMSLFPRNVPVAVRYADTLIQTGHARQAHLMLLDVFNNTQPTPEQIRLTALAASAAGDTGDASYYMAEYHVSNGDLALANQQLELALASPNLTTVQRQRFRARLEEIREWMREEREARASSP